MGRWTLGGAEFTALWSATGQDRIPYPFAVSSSVPTRERYTAQQKRIREDFAARPGDLLDAALLLLAQPGIRIELAGSVGSLPIRVIGAMDRHHGIVALQHPDVGEHSGDVVLLGCEPYDVARQVLAQIPPTEPGRRRGAQFRRTDVASSPDTLLRNPSSRHPLRPVADLLDRPATGEGVVTVVTGPRHASTTRGGASWRDIGGDGRYIVFGDDTVTVQPGTSWDLLSVLNALTGALPAGQAR